MPRLSREEPATGIYWRVVSEGCGGAPHEVGGSCISMENAIDNAIAVLRYDDDSGFTVAAINRDFAIWECMDGKMHSRIVGVLRVDIDKDEAVIIRLNKTNVGKPWRR